VLGATLTIEGVYYSWVTRNSNAASADGLYPFFTCSRETFRTDTYSFDTEAVLLAGNNAIGVYPLKYFKGKFDAYQRTYVITTLDPDTITNRFLYYVLQPQLERLQTLSTGAATKFLTLTILKSLEVSIPPLHEQQRVTSILSAYDDLIENNTRRIEILEEMARRLYEEWFVHFRFPGHEEVSFKESELGEIPEGWEVRYLDDLMGFQGGAQPPKSEWIETESDGYIRMIQIRDYASDAYVAYVKDTSKLRKCEPLDIMIARYGASVGRICWGLRGAYNVALVKVQPKEPYLREFLRSTLSEKTTQDLLIGMSGRTAQAGFNKSILKSISVAVPCDSVTLENFESFVLPIRTQILALRAKATNLRAQRDLLLPKLVSGEIDVSEIPMPDDKEVEAA
ncbi:restriction endonuclease subunit S, partial [Marinobacter sp.]|uniref:restriction endonuclease subunit S n=1 Tax=Marinobacter sp. TaxID=50741 RepID=UPI001989C189